MPRWGMVIDLDKCTACQACVAACRQENNVPFAGPEGTARRRAMFWMEVLAKVEDPQPNPHAEHTVGHFLPRPCMHCDNPPCVQVCPVEATYKDKEGLVRQRDERCIGCRYCMVACPYGVRHFNWEKPSWPEPMGQYLNPNVQVRPKGVVEKCTFCIQRIQEAEAEGKKIGSEHKDGVVTACAQTCTGGAIYFGDLDDHSSLVHRLAEGERAYRLLEDLGTEPKVYYLAEG